MLWSLKYLFTFTGRCTRLELFFYCLGWIAFFAASSAILFFYLSGSETDLTSPNILDYSHKNDAQLESQALKLVFAINMLTVLFFVSFLSMSSCVIRRLNDISQPWWLWLPAMLSVLIFFCEVLMVFLGYGESSLRSVISNVSDIADSVGVFILLYSFIIFVALLVWPSKKQGDLE